MIHVLTRYINIKIPTFVKFVPINNLQITGSKAELNVGLPRFHLVNLLNLIEIPFLQRCFPFLHSQVKMQYKGEYSSFLDFQFLFELPPFTLTKQYSPKLPNKLQIINIM